MTKFCGRDLPSRISPAQAAMYPPMICGPFQICNFKSAVSVYPPLSAKSIFHRENHRLQSFLYVPFSCPVRTALIQHHPRLDQKSSNYPGDIRYFPVANSKPCLNGFLPADRYIDFYRAGRKFWREAELFGSREGTQKVRWDCHPELSSTQGNKVVTMPLSHELGGASEISVRQRKAPGESSCSGACNHCCRGGENGDTIRKVRRIDSDQGCSGSSGTTIKQIRHIGSLAGAANTSRWGTVHRPALIDHGRRNPHIQELPYCSPLERARAGS